jgi:hypothetical protein
MDTYVGVSSNFLTRSPAVPIATNLHKPFFSFFKIPHVYLQEICDSNETHTMYEIVPNLILKSPYCGNTHLFQKFSKRPPTLQSSFKSRGHVFPGSNDSYISLAYFETQTIGKN